jgi:hypothetical protein
MKRFYLLVLFAAAISGTTMAQFAKLPHHTNTLRKADYGYSSVIKNNSTPQRDAVIWSCDFEEGSPEPTLTKTDDSQVIWDIITESDYPDEMYTSSGGCYFLPMNYTGHPGNNDPHQQISETPAHWAFVDAGSDRYNSAPQINTSMTFSGIDLSSCAKPKVTFLQSWKELNSTKEEIKVETSLDGGATWTEHVVNDEEVASYTYINGYKEVLIPEAGNSDNVAIRFTYTSESGTWNYGWQIDDIKIVEIPENNLTANMGRMNFWGYKDYTDPEQLAQYTGSMDPAVFYYQYNDPYAQTPRKNWVNAESEWDGYIIFNLEVTNNGYATVTPKANVKITSPSGTVIFNRTLDADRTLAMGESDTIDFYTANEDIFSFGVTDPEDIEVGRYTVTFSVSADGATDITPEDNTTEYFFDITDNNYAMVYDEPDASFGMSQYTSSASGEEVAEYFYYFFLPDDELNVDVYITSGSTPNTTSFKIMMYEFNEDGEMRPFAMSSPIVTTEEMLGTWTTVSFTDPCYIDAFDTNYASKSILVGIISYYENTANDKLYYGSTNRLPAFHHNVIGRSADEDEFGGYGYPPIALRLHKKNETAVETVSMNDVNMYPNPSNGIVNFSNVENATIEVYNMMGQVVASVENATANTSIDLSNVATGNYIVRVVKDGNIATSKLNIVK